MNERNFDHLILQLKNNGFGNNLVNELREKMLGQKDEFTLLYNTQISNDDVEVALYFRKSDLHDIYFLSRFFMQVKRQDDSEPIIQSFRITRDNNITLSEAYNLMQGRAVYKELTPKVGKKYQAWLQLNFKDLDEFGDFRMNRFHQNYGFDLRLTLLKYPIVELENVSSAHALMRSLEKGNRQMVTIRTEGEIQKVYIETNPQFKSLLFFNDHQVQMSLKDQENSDKEI